MSDRYYYNTYALKDTSRHPDNKSFMEKFFGNPGTPIVSDFRMPKVAQGKGDMMDQRKGDMMNVAGQNDPNSVIRSLLLRAILNQGGGYGGGSGW